MKTIVKMDMKDLPDMYALSPRACGPWASNIQTVVWEKLVVGNFHEKNSVIKNFRLSRLQISINYSISLW